MIAPPNGVAVRILVRLPGGQAPDAADFVHPVTIPARLAWRAASRPTTPPAA